MAGLFGRLGGHRVILAELVDVTIAKQVHPAVAHMRGGQLAFADGHGRQGRAHPAQLGYDHGHVVDLVVGVAGGSHQSLRLGHSRRQFAKRAHQSQDGALAGEIAPL